MERLIIAMHEILVQLSRIRNLLILWLLIGATLFSALWGAEASVLPLSESSWVLVDTEQLTLEVFRGKTRLLRLPHISIGRGGAGPDRRRGDHRTPLGRYRIVWFNPHSRFHFFIGLDYPTQAQVERAFRQGTIGVVDYEHMRAAFRAGRVPPQNSPLGGQIGIHGLGAGNLALHEMANWTEGCIALTNAQIDRLRLYVTLGTPVLIR